MTTKPPKPMKMSYEDVRDYVRHYSNEPGEPGPYDLYGVIYLMLAGFDNLRQYWMDDDLDVLGQVMSAEQRRDFVRIGRLLEGFTPEPDDANGSPG